MAVGSSPAASSAVSPAAPDPGPDGPAARRTDPAKDRKRNQNTSPAAPPDWPGPPPDGPARSPASPD
jgi:hypothetical protein